MYFSSLSNNARVWVYQSNRPLTDSEKNQISGDLPEFIGSWAAHGSKLLADAVIINDYFVVLSVDEQQAMASGCSIDSSVKFIKKIGEHYKIDFFNRLKLVVQKGDVTKMIAFSDLAEYADWNIYNTLVTTVEELNTAFLIPVISSDVYKMSFVVD